MMAAQKSKDAASKADQDTAAKTEGGSGGPKAGQQGGKSAKAEPETKDKAKIVAPIAEKPEGPPSGADKKPAPGDPAATVSGTRPDDTASAAAGGADKSTPSKPSPASGGSFAWILAVALGLVVVIGFPMLIGSHGDEVDALRAQLALEQQAIDEYPNAVAALAAIHAERADIEGRRDAVQADLGGLLAEREAIQGALAETLAERDTRQARIGELETLIVELEAERDRLDGVIRATSDDLQAAMNLLEAARNRISR